MDGHAVNEVEDMKPLHCKKALMFLPLDDSGPTRFCSHEYLSASSWLPTSGFTPSMPPVVLLI